MSRRSRCGAGWWSCRGSRECSRRRVALVTPLVTPLAFPVLGFAFQGEELPFDGLELVVSALGVFTTVWLARTAHERARPALMPAAETAMSWAYRASTDAAARTPYSTAFAATPPTWPTCYA
ncbi:hypothetical protein AB0J28_34495 [Streptosporangium canum]|uniref:hypothetical protein n=1 Tax=Streptosporangium canum TaxID=324952 RepID=UPI003414494B